MGILDVIVMALKNLFKRKVRTFLTAIGVTIGAMAIVLTISLGIAANMNFDRELEQFGDLLNIEIFNWSNNWGPDGQLPPDVVMNLALLDYIASWDGVEVATPILELWQVNAQIGRRNNDRLGGIIGIRPEAMPYLPDFRDIDQGMLLQPGGDPWQAVLGSEVPFGFMTPQEREAQWRQQWGGGGGGGIWIGGFGSSGGAVHSMSMESDSGVNAQSMSFEVTPARVVITPGRPMPGMPGMPGAEQPARIANVDVFNETVEISYDWNAFEPPTPPNPNPDPNMPIIVVNRHRPIYEIQVVGVMYEVGSWSLRNGVIMDIETVMMLQNNWEQHRINQGQNWVNETDFDLIGFERAIIRAKDIHTVEEVFLRLYDMEFAWINSPLGEISSLRRQSNNLQTLLTLLGVISLVVAFIGIANTMIMSIYERTKEIGVMKVIGAALSDIGKLFLVEAAMIGVLGGLMGLALSYGVSHFLNNLEDGFALRLLEALIPQGGGYVSYIPMWLYGLALAFSALVGLVAGLFPAVRAMSISALTAIRTD